METGIDKILLQLEPNIPIGSMKYVCLSVLFFTGTLMINVPHRLLIFYMFDLILYLLFNNFSVMLG